MAKTTSAGLTFNRLLLALLLAFLGLFTWSGYTPVDRFTWYLEVAPACVGVAILVATRRRFPLTLLVYTGLFIQGVILCVGGHYTYAQVPLFNWVRDSLELSRNHFDRVGHFAQGFFPALLVREILLRTSPLRAGKWLFFLVVCVCLAVSASYELVEWAVAMIVGESSTAFLGTQGDEWDTQWDMALCLIGAILSLLLFVRRHDRQLSSLRRLPQSRSLS